MRATNDLREGVCEVGRTQRTLLAGRAIVSGIADITPTPDAFASMGGVLIHDLLAKVPAMDRFVAAQMMESAIDIIRYLAVTDHKEGTSHLAALIKRAMLFPVPPNIAPKDTTETPHA